MAGEFVLKASVWAAILFSLSASYNLIIFYELALLLVICPFLAIGEMGGGGGGGGDKLL
jgi:hypothetical protein